MIGVGPIAYQGIAWLRRLIMPEPTQADPRTYTVLGGLGATFTADGGIGATYACAGGLGATFTVEGSEEGMTPVKNFEFEVNEDLEINITIPTTDDMSGWTVDAVIERADDGTVVTGATASVTDNANKIVTAVVPSGTLTPGNYRFAARRTDTGSRKTLLRSVLNGLDPIGE